MFLQRLSYESVGDGAAASPCVVTRVGAKASPAVALLTLTALALYGFVTFGNFEARSATETTAGWLDRQPVAGETLTTFSRSLQAPEDRWSEDGELRTTLRVAPAVSQASPLAPPLNVRAYEGSVPGPTLRVKAGDRLVINLVNDLCLPEGAPAVAAAGAGEEVGGALADSGGDGYASMKGKVEAWPNVTNIHVHGLHVSPSGIADNIYRRAGPGDALEYVYDLPADHYPGIFYYHPHFEGSSSVQTLGGMSGAIVVEDPEGSLPPELEAMREVVMVLQETNIESGSLRNYKSASEIAGSKMPLYRAHGIAGEGNMSTTTDTSMLHFVTVNGQYQPVISARPGEALRLRVVHGGNNDHMHVSLMPAKSAGPSDRAAAAGASGAAAGAAGSASSSGCTLLTLARDGVYLPAPRRQGGGDGHVVLAPGSRADLAVRCDRPGTYLLVSSKGGLATAAGVDGDEVSGVMVYLGQRTDVFEGTLAFLDVGGGAVDMPLPTKSPVEGSTNRLLQDLRGLPKNEVSRFVFEFNSADKVSHLGQTYTWYGINGVQYSGASYVMRRVPLGSVEEWVIVNQRKGRGEGAEDCHPPSASSTATELERPMGDGIGSGNGSSGAAAGHGGGHGHSRRRRLGEQPAAGNREASENGARGRQEKGRGRDVRVACERAGPGEVTADGHPFHLHVNHFQVVSSSWGDEGPDWNVGDWRDTISIPAPGNVTVRWRADDFTGESVAHCHIFGHSDTGMMMNFEIFDEL